MKQLPLRFRDYEVCNLKFRCCLIFTIRIQHKEDWTPLTNQHPPGPSLLLALWIDNDDFFDHKGDLNPPTRRQILFYIPSFQLVPFSTLQIDNTDAEGRLILADALCYASSFEPRVMVDLATLTGAISVALGPATCGVFTNSKK